MKDLVHWICYKKLDNIVGLINAGKLKPVLDRVYPFK